MDCADAGRPAHKSAYGPGYVNGTIIGIVKGADHEEEAEARQVTDDERSCQGEVLERT